MISTEQREARRKSIGSSDSPAILGMDPFRNAYAVWAEKTGRDPGFAGNEATERGNLLEPPLINWLERKLDIPLSRNVMFGSADGLPLACNLDAVSDEPGRDRFIVEAKTAATATNPDEWGDEGTDEVPERVLVQTHHAMFVTGHKLALVPVMLPVYGRFDFRIYRIPRNDDLAQAIADRACAFWKDHVLADVAPPDCVPSIEVLKRLRRQPDKVVPLADELVDAWIVAKAAKKQAEEEEKASAAALLASLGDAEGGEYAGGMVTYFSTTRKGYTVSETTFRTLRLKAAKGSK